MRLQPALPADINRLAEVAGANPFSAHWSAQEFLQEINQPCARVYTLRENNTIIAFISYRVVAPDAELTNFAVFGNCLRRGLGSFVLGESIKELAAQGVKNITLEVNVTNTPAMNLYEKFLFKTVSLRKKFYNNSQDAALMRLNL